jgi:FAD/FMN-containing dehydrogenase
MSMSTGPSRTPPEVTAPKAKQGQTIRQGDPEANAKGKDFHDRMEKLSQAELSDRGGNVMDRSPGAKGKIKGWQRQDDSQREGSAEGGGGAANIASDFARSLALAQTQATSEIPPEHLARMLAAIEEMVDKGVMAEYQLSLPAGPTTIEGAVLGRDPSGKLHVQLLANAPVGAAVMQQLQNALRQRLATRKGAFGRVEVSYSANGKAK